MAGVSWKKLPFEWKLLVGAFITTCVILFLVSLHLVSNARECLEGQCVLSALTLFTWVSFTLLVLNVGVLVIFMFSFYLREEQKKRKRKKKRR